MALVKCPECGHDVSNTAKRCPNCGFKLPKPQKSLEEKKKARLLTVILVISGIILASAAVGGFLGYKYYLRPMNIYKDAVAYEEAGNYDAAIENYSSIEDFKDSSDRIRGCIYRKGTAFLNEGAYEEAKEIFEDLGNYSDSENLSKECDYRKAENLLDEADYDGAISLFSSISDYADSEEMIKECKYRAIIDKYGDIKLYDVKSTLAAEYIAAMNELGDYKDCATLLKTKEKQSGDAFYKTGKYREAIKWYERCSDYEDSHSLMVDSYKKLAESEISLGKYEGAINLYNEMTEKGFEEAEVLKNELYASLYAQGSEAFSNGNLSLARSMFSLLKTYEYKDSAEQYDKVLQREEELKAAAKKEAEAKAKKEAEAKAKKDAETKAKNDAFAAIAGTWNRGKIMIKISGNKWGYYVDQDSWNTFKSFGLDDTIKYDSGVYYFYEDFWGKTYAGVLDGDTLTLTLYQDHNTDRPEMHYTGTYTHTSTSIN